MGVGDGSRTARLMPAITCAGIRRTGPSCFAGELLTKEPQASEPTDSATGSWSVCSENVFDILLFEFQRAYAEFGTELFFLGGFTYDEIIAEQQTYEVAGCVGVVPLDEGGGGGEWLVCENGLRRVADGLGGGGSRCYYIFAKNKGRFAQPYSVFKALAARAGAFLPLTAKQKVPGDPADPVSLWLAYMWSCNPPSDEYLAVPEGVTHDHRVIWSNPFLTAVEIIERNLVGQASTVQDQEGAIRSGTLRGVQQDKPGNAGRKEIVEGDAVIDDLVTLLQVEAIAGIKKRTLDGYLRKGKIPKPDSPGGGGRPHKWYWKRLRPYLAKYSTKLLPRDFPATRILPSGGI